MSDDNDEKKNWLVKTLVCSKRFLGKGRHITFAYGNEVFSFGILLVFFLAACAFVPMSESESLRHENYAPNSEQESQTIKKKSQTEKNHKDEIPLKWKLSTWRGDDYVRDVVPGYLFDSIWIYTRSTGTHTHTLRVFVVCTNSTFFSLCSLD